MILDVHFINEQTGFVAGSSSRDIDTTNAQILMTRDGGTSWHEVYRTHRPAELIWKLAFPTARVGTTLGGFETKDGGRHWSPAPVARAANKFRVLRDADGGAGNRLCDWHRSAGLAAGWVLIRSRVRRP